MNDEKGETETQDVSTGTSVSKRYWFIENKIQNIKT